MSDKFPQTSRTDILPEKNSFPSKSIGKDWGATNEAANAPNTPSMSQAKDNPSPNLIANYCDEDE